MVSDMSDRIWRRGNVRQIDLNSGIFGKMLSHVTTNPHVELHRPMAVRTAGLVFCFWLFVSSRKQTRIVSSRSKSTNTNIDSSLRPGAPGGLLINSFICSSLFNLENSSLRLRNPHRSKKWHHETLIGRQRDIYPPSNRQRGAKHF